MPDSGTQGTPGATPALAALTAAAMVAFAANSLLARLALRTTAIDAASFTAIRLAAGALTLLLLLSLQSQPIVPARAPTRARTAWLSAALLFTYAAAFSFAYRRIDAGAGALVLFAAAQCTMISYGLAKGERASPWGMLCAGAGLVVFLAPSSTAPPPGAAGLMALAGCAWGGFSLLGRGAGAPVADTAAAFVRAVPMALVLLLVERAHLRLDWTGAGYALLSGSVASAIGYAVWYWVRARMTRISAGAVQLSVPLLSVGLGILLLGEAVSLRSAVSAAAVLGGVAWVTLTARSGDVEAKKL
jgi:drug/metabolite transporter (DMT)-like permease